MRRFGGPGPFKPALLKMVSPAMAKQLKAIQRDWARGEVARATKAILGSSTSRTSSPDAATHKVTGSHQDEGLSQNIQTGPRGGQYYVASTGSKVYKKSWR